MKSLVVFYSRTGNARFVAQTIAAQIGADTEEIVDLKKRSGAFGFLSGGSDARRGKETEIEPTKRSAADYDFIIVGTPIWAGRPTPAITTFLKKTDLSGKKVSFFFVQGGKKPQGIAQAKALIPNSNYMGELVLIDALKSKEDSERRITEWCDILTSS
jgi:flavodoxin